jgi:mRNA interferase MazF
LKAPDRGDIVWLDFDPQTGREQSGRRPGLILSPRDYNFAVGLALICPITSRQKGYPFEIALPPGLPVTGVILADHLRSLDWRARHAEFLCRAPEEVVAETIAKAATLLSDET